MKYSQICSMRRRAFFGQNQIERRRYRSYSNTVALPSRVM